MSAFGGKADILDARSNVRFLPKADIEGRSRMGSTLKLSSTTSPNNSSVGSYGVGGVVGVVGAGVAGFVIGAVGAGGALLVM